MSTSFSLFPGTHLVYMLLVYLRDNSSLQICMSQRNLRLLACVAEIMRISQDSAVALAEECFCCYRLYHEYKYSELNSKSNFNLVSPVLL